MAIETATATNKLSYGSEEEKKEISFLTEISHEIIPVLLQIVLEYCELKVQLWMCHLNPKLKIKDLLNSTHDLYLLNLLNDNILKLDMFSKLIKLNASDNPSITNINHLSELEELIASSDHVGCGINNQSFQ